MGGLGFFIAISMYIVLAVLVVWRTPKAWGKALAVAAAILLPTADAWWGRYVTLPELCKDAGLKVFKKPIKQQGLMYSGAVHRQDKVLLGKSGYYDIRVEYWGGEDEIRLYDLGFVESLPQQDGTCERLSVIDGKVIRESKVTPKSKYVFGGWNEIPTAFGKNFGGSEMRIEDRQTGEVISRYRKYGFRGGWAERFLGGFADGGSQGVGCTSSAVDEYTIQLQTTFE